jgi:hypothetical protein
MLDQEKELIQSRRVEYQTVISTWRFVIAGRAVLIVSAITGLSAVMNVIRTSYLKTKEVVLTEGGGSFTMADDTLSFLAGALIVIGIGVCAWLVLQIDKDFAVLQDEALDQGVTTEASLGLEGGLLHRASQHRAHIHGTFSFARAIFVVVCSGWVSFIWSICR